MEKLLTLENLKAVGCSGTVTNTERPKGVLLL